VEDLYIEENLDDQNIDNISKLDSIKWAINSFKPSSPSAWTGSSRPNYNGHWIYPYPG